MSSLETSVTLDEVFIVVNAKRVPLAPELAGYLALEIAEGADAAGGDVDPKFVFIGEEGTVGLVRPRREAPTGDAELSVRSILARLLDSSGSQTPALSSASRRRGTGGLPSLVEELEAALIPVNRAAGRRALARLAREVKRVTLGVGRNALVPPSERAPRGSSPSHVAIHTLPAQEAEPPARPPVAPTSFAAEEEGTRGRGQIPAEVRSSAPPAAEAAAKRSAPPPPVEPTPPIPIVDASDLPTIQFEPSPRPADAVDQLIASFDVARSSDAAIGRELKAMIGLDPTAPPPATQARAPRESDVDALLALTGEPTPPPPKRASMASTPDHANEGAAAPPPLRAPPVTVATPAEAPRAKARTDPPPPPNTARRRANPRDPDQTSERQPAPVIAVAPQPSERQLPTGPSKLRLSHSSIGGERKSRTSTIILIVLALIALGLGAVVLLSLKPGFLSGRTQEKVDQERAEAEAKAKQGQNAQATCRATLLVTDVPPSAEVLIRVGQAPIDVPKMPVGKRLEFVATAEGYASKRAVVPAGAPWAPGADGKEPRIEQGVQLDKLKPNAPDLWPGAEAGSTIGGNGPPGTVRIWSSPTGAEIWLLAGIGPEAKIDLPQCDADVEVLVAASTNLRKRMSVPAASFVRQEAEPKGSGAVVRVAKVSVKK